MNSNKPQTTNTRTLLFTVIVLATCATQFASDIYAPSILAISQNLGTSIKNVQWSMSIYMLGVAISQLIYGPVSEGIGRKKPIVLGLIIMIIGSIICVLSNIIELLLIGRLIQGAGAGACASLWRSIFRDSFTGAELSEYTSYLVIFIMFIVPSAPLIGGYLQEYYGYKASFIFITVYSIIALLGITLFFGETNKNYHRSKLTSKYVIENYLTLLKSPIFMGITCSTFLSYGAFFTWFVVGPVLLIDIAKMTPSQFGWFTFCGGGSAYALAGYINGKVVKKLGMACMMRFGWSVMLVSGLLMLLGHIYLGTNIWAISIAVVLFYFGSTFIWPNAFATAFTPFGHIAGYAGALYGFMQICGAASISGIISYLPNNNQFSLSVVMIVSSLFSWIIYEISISNSVN